MDTLIATEKLVELAPFTTLGVGGPASQLVRITSTAQALEAVRWWRGLEPVQRPALLPLGGGSNVLISDSGFEGLVVKMENSHLEVLEQTGEQVVVRVGAGMVWDQFVAHATTQNWAGVECLSGIPGCVGASPVQNIGAYGQEVSETIKSVGGIDTRTGEEFRFTNEQCRFSYRDSFFKRQPAGRYLITSVDFQLRPGGEPTIRYADLKTRCENSNVHTLEQVRSLVLEIRRSKSMVYDTEDPNHRSAGSFFTNPIVSSEIADRIERRLPQDTRFPRFPVGEGREKLSAAWLIDNSGLKKGFRLSEASPAGLSTNHVLALTNRGGARAEDLIQLCRHVQRNVEEAFGISLVPEPVFIGFSRLDADNPGRE